MIDAHVPDGTFVKEVAKLVHPNPKLETVPRGQSIFMAGENYKLIGEPLLAEPKTLQVSTLTAVVDYYKANCTSTKGDCSEVESGARNILIHVGGPQEVRIVSPSVGDEKQQFVYLRATCDAPAPRYGYYEELEFFIISLLTNYIHTPGRAAVLDYVGSLTAGLASEISDDGATQSVVAKRGITRAGAPMKFENPVTLAPYRTFHEVDQPSSPFVLRLKQTQSGDSLVANATLFEADGGRWRTEAVQSIGVWLREQLPDAVILA